MRPYELLCLPKLLRSVHGDPEARVAVSEELALRRQPREGRFLVIAALRQPFDAFVIEHVDAGAHPLGQERRFAETGDRVVVVQLDDGEGRAHLRDDERRRGATPAMVFEQLAQIDAEQLVAVQRIDRTALLPMLCGEAKPSPTPERLVLADGDDLGAEAAELALEERLETLGAGDDDPRHPRFGQTRHLVRGEGPTGDGDERLRTALRRIAEALGLAARQDQRLHYVEGSGSRSGVS